MAKNQESPANDDDVPSWIKVSLFEPVFKEISPDYHQTKQFKVKPGVSAGENFTTIMLRLEADIELKDGSLKTISLMLKTAHNNEMFREMMKIHNIFNAEATMYREIVPELEQMYKHVGVDVKFGAKFYELSTDQPYILLEDLKPKGFVNVNRLEGLDMEHTHSVLTKLAQWHAASAVRVATKGAYNKNMTEGFLKEESREMIKAVLSSMHKVHLDCVKSYDGHELYYERLSEQLGSRIDNMYEGAKLDLNEFNVLNHGDCWSNNIMFKHDAFGKIKETYLVDYQVPRYGSPAQDLYYFLLSSTKYELKIKHFDYFIKYYHTELLKHLKLFHYSKKMPSLKDIHISLHKHNSWALSTVTGVMSTVLLDPNNNANIDNFIGEDNAGIKLKMQMFSSPRYRKHSEMILPWLYNRGAI